MPPKLGEKYDDALYVVKQDGSYAKLTDIKEFDIGSSEPPEGYAQGGETPYDDAPVFKYRQGPPMDYVHGWTDITLSFTPAKHLNLKKMYMALIGLTKRQQRLVIRRMERMRREELKTGVRYENRLMQACIDVQKKQAIKQAR